MKSFDKIAALHRMAKILGYVKWAAEPEMEKQIPHVVIFKDCDGKVLVPNDPSRHPRE